MPKSGPASPKRMKRSGSNRSKGRADRSAKVAGLRASAAMTVAARRARAAVEEVSTSFQQTLLELMQPLDDSLPPFAQAPSGGGGPGGSGRKKKLVRGGTGSPLRLSLVGVALPDPGVIASVLRKMPECRRLRELSLEVSCKGLQRPLAVLSSRLTALNIVGAPAAEGVENAQAEVRGSDLIELLKVVAPGEAGLATDWDVSGSDGSDDDDNLELLVGCNQLESFRFVGHAGADSVARMLGAVVAANADTLTYVDIADNSLSDKSLETLTSMLKRLKPGLPLDSHLGAFTIAGNGSLASRLAVYSIMYQRIVRPYTPPAGTGSGSPAHANGRGGRTGRGNGTTLSASDFPADPEKIEALVSLVAPNQVVKFAITDTDLSSSAARGLITELLRSAPKQLRSVALLRCAVDDTALEAMAESLGYNNRIREQLQDGNPIDASRGRGVSLLNKMLRMSKKCGLETCDLKNDDLQTLLRVRKRCFGDTVDLARMGLTKSHMKIVASLLKTNKKLADLDLSGNPIGSSGLKLLCAALASSKTKSRLGDLTLTDCGIDDVGASLLAKVLHEHPALAAINLTNNRITDVGARQLHDVMRHNRRTDMVELEGNLLEAVAASELHAARMIKTPPKIKKSYPVIDTDMRTGRELDISVGGMLHGHFGSSVLIQPNDIVGISDMAGPMGSIDGPPIGGSLRGLGPRKARANAHAQVAATLSRVTYKGIGQLPPARGKMQIMADIVELVPHALSFSMGAIVRMYHGLHATKSSKGFRVLFFEGYERFQPKAGAGGAGAIQAVEDAHDTSTALVAKGAGGSDETKDGGASDGEAADEHDEHAPHWSVVERKWYRIAGPYVEVVSTRAGFFVPAWDFTDGPAEVRVHAAAFSITRGVAKGDGLAPVFVWCIPDPRSPGELAKEMQRVALVMLQMRPDDAAGVTSGIQNLANAAPRPGAVGGGWGGDPDSVLTCVGATQKPFILRQGERAAVSVAGETLPLHAPWERQPQMVGMFQLPITAEEGERQRGKVTVYPEAALNNGRVRPVASFTMSVPVVTRRPAAPKKFRVVMRTRHSTLFDWDPTASLMSATEYRYRLEVCRLGLMGYSNVDRMIKAHLGDKPGILKFHEYWHGSGDNVEIDNDFYAAIFRLIAYNKHGESIPSELTLVHPSTQFADDRMALSKAVRNLEQEIIRTAVDSAVGSQARDVSPSPAGSPSESARSLSIGRSRSSTKLSAGKSGGSGAQDAFPVTPTKKVKVSVSSASSMEGMGGGIAATLQAARAIGSVTTSSALLKRALRKRMVQQATDNQAESDTSSSRKLSSSKVPGLGAVSGVSESTARPTVKTQSLPTLRTPKRRGSGHGEARQRGGSGSGSMLSARSSDGGSGTARSGSGRGSPVVISSQRMPKVLQATKALLRNTLAEVEGDTADDTAEESATPDSESPTSPSSPKPPLGSTGTSARSLGGSRKLDLDSTAATAASPGSGKLRGSPGLKRSGTLQRQGSMRMMRTGSSRSLLGDGGGPLEGLSEEEVSVATTAAAEARRELTRRLPPPGQRRYLLEDVERERSTSDVGDSVSGLSESDLKGRRSRSGSEVSDGTHSSRGTPRKGAVTTQTRTAKSSKKGSKASKGSRGGKGSGKGKGTGKGESTGATHDFAMPDLEVGAMYTRQTLGGVPQHMVDAKNREALSAALRSKDLELDDAILVDLWGFEAVNAYNVLKRQYTFGARAPLVAMVDSALRKLMNRAREALSNRENAVHLIAFAQDSFLRCQRSLILNYTHMLGVLRPLVKLVATLKGHVAQLSAPGWISTVFQSEAATKKLYTFDNKLRVIFSRVPAAGVAEVANNMRLPRKYIDESKDKALSAVFLQSVLSTGTEASLVKGIIPEAARQLDVPVDKCQVEVMRQFRKRRDKVSAKMESLAAKKEHASRDAVPNTSVKSAASVSIDSGEGVNGSDKLRRGGSGRRRSGASRSSGNSGSSKGTPAGAGPATRDAANV